MSLTSIIILTYNNWEKTKPCLDSIRNYTTLPYELIIIDNGSTDGTVQYLKQYPDIRLICNKENKGFAGGCNQGMRIAKGEQLLLLNNDTIVSHNWLENLLSALYISDRVGMVGPLTNHVNSPGTRRPKANYANEAQYHPFARLFNRHDPSKWKAVPVLYGFCVLFKREVMDKIGELDERFGIGTAEDVDYSHRVAKAGYTLLVAGDTFVHHYGNSTFKKNRIDNKKLGRQNWGKFVQKWGGGQANSLYQLSEALIPDGTLVRVTGTGLATFYIEGRTKRQIKNEEAFAVWNWKASDIVEVPNHQLARFSLGESIDQDMFSGKLPNNMLIQTVNENDIFLIQDGKKRPFTSLEALEFYHFDRERVVAVPRKIFESMETGPSIVCGIEIGTVLPNRILLKCYTSYYLSNHHVLHPILPDQIEKLKLSVDHAIDVTPRLLFQYPIGKGITNPW